MAKIKGTSTSTGGTGEFVTGWSQSREAARPADGMATESGEEKVHVKMDYLFKGQDLNDVVTEAAVPTDMAHRLQDSVAYQDWRHDSSMIITSREHRTEPMKLSLSEPIRTPFTPLMHVMHRLTPCLFLPCHRDYADLEDAVLPGGKL